MRKTILITGAYGQLGKSIRELSSDYESDYQFIFTDVDTLDITNKAAVSARIHETGANFVVNTAAYTAVDKAESDVEKAFLLNETAVRNVAEAAAENDAFLVHISTDYVFDGSATVPYPTDFQTNPLSVYGKSKWAGEQAFRSSGAHGAIIRTAWLYSPYGGNFVKTMLRLADSRPEIRVVNDQTGCPTLARDLARFILEVIKQSDKVNGVETFHFANQGRITWYDFACEIIRLAKKNCTVMPISADQYPSPAPRPAFSVFDLNKSIRTFQITVPDWKESLQSVISQIIYNYENDIR